MGLMNLRWMRTILKTIFILNLVAYILKMIIIMNWHICNVFQLQSNKHTCGNCGSSDSRFNLLIYPLPKSYTASYTDLG